MVRPLSSMITEYGGVKSCCLFSHRSVLSITVITNHTWSFSAWRTVAQPSTSPLNAFPTRRSGTVRTVSGRWNIAAKEFRWRHSGNTPNCWSSQRMLCVLGDNHLFLSYLLGIRTKYRVFLLFVSVLDWVSCPHFSSDFVQRNTSFSLGYDTQSNEV